MVKDIYPDFSYKTVHLKNISSLNIDENDMPFVIKPAVGFFSLGVHIIHNISQWEEAKKELNYKNIQNIFTKEVIDTSTFIIEEYIEGDEYAVNCYFDKQGEIVILNILHHKFSSGTDTSYRVYSTSKEIINTYKGDVEKFLTLIGNKTGLKNSPFMLKLELTKQAVYSR